MQGAADHGGKLGMKRAIISDVHGNLEALTAVLDDIASQGITRIYCLGDIVGYGPNPRECVDRVMDCDLVVLGNHDQGALFDPEGFSSGAERAIFWTREQLEQPGDNAEQTAARWRFLSELPRTQRENGYLFVHGSARNPLNEYVFPEDVYNARKIEKIFALITGHCFQGHTHVPGVFTESGQFFSPDQIDGVYTLGRERTMVNVGSVGQPRDGDTRSCYVVLEDERPELSPDDPRFASSSEPGDDESPATVTFRRVEYPVDTTVAKIHAIPELDRFLGDRLKEGR